MVEQPCREMVDLLGKWGENKQLLAKADIQLNRTAKKLTESLIYMNTLLRRIIFLMGGISVFWLIWMLMIMKGL